MFASSRQREELIDVTAQVRRLVRASGVQNGLIHLWSLHTTCALTVNEGADPDVALDLVRILRGLVPQEGPYRHQEGNSDAHLKTSLFGPGLTLIIENNQLMLGTWQHVFLAEWDGPRERQIAYLILSA
ncbi:MAG: secondary thiamine-phosphate synthase enzyme YjbQ [Longimicrobiales bacterium]